MTEIAQTYLGNVARDSHLAELIARENYLEVVLNQNDRAKGRIYTNTDCGVTIGIVKSRDLLLQSGDLFKTDAQKLLLVRLEEPKCLVLDFSTWQKDLIPIRLVYLGHVLGNHHYPIAIQDDKIYVELTTEPKILEQIINDVQIPGLEIRYETQKFKSEVTFSTHSH